MQRQLKFIRVATDLSAPVNERYPEYRHRLFSPGPRARYQIGLPMDQLAGRQSPTTPT